MKITWITGYPKSGTTWLRAFLSSYIYGQLDINNMQGFALDDLQPVVWQTISSKPLPDIGVAEAAALRGAALHALLIANEGKVTLRTHSSVADIIQFPMIPTAFTDRAVQVVRDPRDIAVSFAHYVGCTQEEAVNAMSQPTSQQKAPGLYWMLGDWSGHVMSWVNAAFPVRTIKYEDMLKHNQNSFQSAIAFLDIQTERDRFYRALELTGFKAMRDQEQNNGFREMKNDGPFFRRGQAEAWKDELKPELAKQIEDQHGDVMKYFGYETSEMSEEAPARPAYG